MYNTLKLKAMFKFLLKLLGFIIVMFMSFFITLSASDSGNIFAMLIGNAIWIGYLVYVCTRKKATR